MWSCERCRREAVHHPGRQAGSLARKQAGRESSAGRQAGRQARQEGGEAWPGFLTVLGCRRAVETAGRDGPKLYRDQGTSHPASWSWQEALSPQHLMWAMSWENMPWDFCRCHTKRRNGSQGPVNGCSFVLAHKSVKAASEVQFYRQCQTERRIGGAPQANSSLGMTTTKMLSLICHDTAHIAVLTA